MSMSDRDSQIEAFFRRGRLKRIALVLMLISPVAFYITYAITTKQAVAVERTYRIAGATTTFSDLGNHTRLQIDTDQGIRYIALPNGRRLKDSGYVVVLEGEGLLGRRYYSFLRYDD